MKALHMVAFILVVIGGLNWLLTVFGWELGTNVFGGMENSISKTIYVLIGLSAIYLLFTHKKDCKTCSGMSA